MKENERRAAFEEYAIKGFSPGNLSKSARALCGADAGGVPGDKWYGRDAAAVQRALLFYI